MGKSILCYSCKGIIRNSHEIMTHNILYIFFFSQTRRLLKDNKKDKYTNNKIQRKAKKTKELLAPFRVKPEIEIFRDGNVKEKAKHLLARHK